MAKPQTVDPSKLTREQKIALARPLGFAKGLLGMQLYPQQEAVLRAIEPPGAVAFKSCNEGGKTSRVAVAVILWHLARFKRGKVVSTSGSFRQIEDQLVPALRRYETRFPGWKFHKTPNITTQDPNGFYLGFSTNDAGKFEGFHAENEQEPLLIILDEAKSIGPDIFQAVERCKATRVLVMSSPGLAAGPFYDCFTSNARFYHCLSQRATDCPHWKPEDIAKIRAKWAGAPEFVGSMLDAEFITSSEEMAIQLADVDAAVGNPPAFRDGERKLFLDFGGGIAENVVAMREGNRITIEDAWRDANTMAAVGRFIANFHRLGARPEEIEGDAHGMGAVMMDRMKEQGWDVVRCFTSGPPNDRRKFKTRTAEMWIEGGQAFKAGTFIIPDDPELRGQLTTRKKAYTSDGRIDIEDKEDMAKRGVPSPDRADAVLGAMGARKRLVSVPTNQARQVMPWDDAELEDQSVYAGFNAGG